MQKFVTMGKRFLLLTDSSPRLRFISLVLYDPINNLEEIIIIVRLIRNTNLVDA